MIPPSLAESGHSSTSRRVQLVTQVLAGIQLLVQFAQQATAAAGEQLLNGRQAVQCPPDETQIAGRRTARRHAGQQTLEVVDVLEFLTHVRTQAGFSD